MSVSGRKVTNFTNKIGGGNMLKDVVNINIFQYERSACALTGGQFCGQI